MAVRDGVGGARLYAVATENAARVVYVVSACISVAGGDALRLGVFGGFDIDTVSGTGGGTEKTGYAFFKAIFVAMKDVNSAVARLKVDRFFRVILRGGFAPQIPERDAETLSQRYE